MRSSGKCLKTHDCLCSCSHRPKLGCLHYIGHMSNHLYSGIVFIQINENYIHLNRGKQFLSRCARFGGRVVLGCGRSPKQPAWRPSGRRGHSVRSLCYFPPSRFTLLSPFSLHPPSPSLLPPPSFPCSESDFPFSVPLSDSSLVLYPPRSSFLLLSSPLASFLLLPVTPCGETVVVGVDGGGVASRWMRTWAPTSAPRATSRRTTTASLSAASATKMLMTRHHSQRPRARCLGRARLLGATNRWGRWGAAWRQC